MNKGNQRRYPAKFFIFILTAFLALVIFISRRTFQASDIAPSTAATYSQGLLT